MGDNDGNLVTINFVSKATVSGVRRTFLLGKTIYLNRVMVKRNQKVSASPDPNCKDPETHARCQLKRSVCRIGVPDDRLIICTTNASSKGSTG